MSSVPEKQQSIIVAINDKRSFFFRKDSIQKIKCTAMYPFQVAGLKLSNNVIIELIEKNIMKARICIQRTLLNFYIIILKLLSTLFTLCDNIKGRYEDVITKKAIDQIENTTTKSKGCRKMRLQRQERIEIIDGDDEGDRGVATDLTTSNKKSLEMLNKSPRQNPEKDSYQSRLLAKLERIERHKSRLNGKSLRLQLLFSSTETEPEPEQDDDEGEKEKDDVENKLKTDLIKNLYLGNSFSKFPIAFTKEPTKEKSNLQKYFLILCVHAGLFIMYLQVLVLCLVLNSVKIPSGLLFLIATGTIIGYILIKVSFFNKVNGKSRKSSFFTDSKQCSTDIPDGGSTVRQARSTKKRAPMLDIDSKTLSKIKLL